MRRVFRTKLQTYTYGKIVFLPYVLVFGLIVLVAINGRLLCAFISAVQSAVRFPESCRSSFQAECPAWGGFLPDRFRLAFGESGRC